MMFLIALNYPFILFAFIFFLLRHGKAELRVIIKAPFWIWVSSLQLRLTIKAPWWSWASSL